MSRIIRVEPLRFHIPHFYCFVLSWGRASFLVWHFACCQHNSVRGGFSVHPFSGHHPYPYASCGGKWGAHHTRWHGSKLCFQLGWCVVYCLPARAYTRGYHLFQVFTPYFRVQGFQVECTLQRLGRFLLAACFSLPYFPVQLFSLWFPHFLLLYCALSSVIIILSLVWFSSQGLAGHVSI